MIDLSFYMPILNELLYRGRCTIRVYQTYEDQKTKKTKERLYTRYSNVPCMLSHSSATTSESSNLPESDQEIRLFLDPEYKVPFGAQITVWQDYKEDIYEHTGVANRYPGHQELNLRKWDKSFDE